MKWAAPGEAARPSGYHVSNPSGRHDPTGAIKWIVGVATIILLTAILAGL